jgi:hypothetical protein
MKLPTKLFTVALGALVLAASAQALTITPTSGTDGVTRWSGPETAQGGPNGINSVIGPLITPSTELYKNDAVENSNLGSEAALPLAGSYHTVYGQTLDFSSATITYTGGNIVGPVAYMLVKDGNNNPGWYLYNLTALLWDGEATLNLSGFWEGVNGAISHISLYGISTPPGDIPPPGVPDSGSTVALIGLAFLALAFVKRKIA